MSNMTSAASGENDGTRNVRTCAKCPLVRELECDNGDGVALFEYYCRYYEKSVTLRSSCNLSILIVDEATKALTDRRLSYKDEDESTDAVSNFSAVVKPNKAKTSWHVEVTPKGDQLSNRPYVVRATKSDDVPPCAIMETERNSGIGMLKLSDETFARLHDPAWTKGEPSMWVKHANMLRKAKKYNIDLRRYAPVRDVTPLTVVATPETKRSGPAENVKLISDSDVETLGFWESYAARAAAVRAAKVEASATGKSGRSLRRAERRAMAALTIPCATAGMTEASA